MFNPDRYDVVVLGGGEAGKIPGWTLASQGVAMRVGLPDKALRDSILTHSTMAEGLVSLFSAVPARA